MVMPMLSKDDLTFPGDGTVAFQYVGGNAAMTAHSSTPDQVDTGSQVAAIVPSSGRGAGSELA